MNYRPVSWTCITCKLFEHIICKHILAHLEDHKILTDLQHGFRSGRSCETQLVTTFQDLAQMHNKKGSQFDIAVLDFSKAFDTVPHDGLLSKLKHYGIDERFWLWIFNFLYKKRKQSVVVNGKQSSLIDVVSTSSTTGFRSQNILMCFFITYHSENYVFHFRTLRMPYYFVRVSFFVCVHFHYFLQVHLHVCLTSFDGLFFWYNRRSQAI